MDEKKKNIIQRIVSIVAVVFLFCVAYKLCYWLVVDDTKTDSRITMHELYSSEENIDVLFLGSSHSMRTVNPEVADAVTGKHTFNAGTAAQYLEASYALLVEAGKNNDISDVYVELYYGQIGREIEERNNCASTYIITDYMKPSLNKLELLLCATPKDYYGDTFDPVRRNKSNFFDFEKISQNINAKNEVGYQEYSYDKTPQYIGRGFVSNTNYVDDMQYTHLGAFYPIAQYTEFDVECLENIIEYCEKRNIALHFYSAPMTDYRLNALGNYDSYIDMMTELLASYGYEYWDFNLLKYEYFSYTGENFDDDNHLNYKGATEFTDILCRVGKGEWSTKQIFYPTYADKLAECEEGVLGIVINQSETKCEIVPSVIGDLRLTYEVLYQDTDGQIREIKERSDENFFTKVEESTGKYEIIIYDECGAEVHHSYLAF